MVNKFKASIPKAFAIILLAAFFIQFGIGLQRNVINIFMEGPVAEGMLALDGEQIGIIASIREIPGLFTVILMLITLFFTESIMAAFCVGLSIVGLIVMAGVTGFNGLIVATLIYSTGFHLYFPVQNALVLGVAEKDKRALRLGQVNAVASIATVLAIIVARIFAPTLGYRSMFLIAAAIASISLLLYVMRSRDDEKREKKKVNLKTGFVFRFKYMSYYLITLLSGSRRHITQTFALYLMLRICNVPAEQILTLTLASTILSIFTKPLLGQFVDRIGERNGLVINYMIITVLFVIYAFVRNVYVLFAVYIIDQVCIGFDVGITTYLSKIADDGDLKSSLAMGSTINHITGVLVPLLGGFLFKRVSPASAFLLGAFISLLSLMQARTLQVDGEKRQAA